MLCDYSRVIISAFEKKYFNHEFFTNYDNIRLNNGDKLLSNISLMIITKEFWGQRTYENGGRNVRTVARKHSSVEHSRLRYCFS